MQSKFFNPLKIYQLNHSDISGGAARAAHRIHHALRAEGVDSSVLVNVALSDDWTVYGPSGKYNKLLARVRSSLGDVVPTWLLKTKNPTLHSSAILPSSWSEKLNQSDADIVHLHWVNKEMMSISDIGRIKKPVVWTLHDMWPFCGAEHYANDTRWRNGYTKKNRPDYESGVDLSRWIWNRKLNAWDHPMYIVAPSKWLADCARESVVMRDWPVSVIHNAIDTEKWRPIERALARRLMQLPEDAFLLAFGAIGGGSDPRKGFDLLLDAFKFLRGQMPDLHLVVFGQLPPRNPPELGFPIHYTGHLSDDISLRILYSAVDAMVVPSRQEAFGQTASEAFSCGTPVVAFSATGLLDIVDHKTNGYLAAPFDSEDLANGVKWILEHPEPRELAQAARTKAVGKFDNRIIAKQYISLYEEILKQDCQ